MANPTTDSASHLMKIIRTSGKRVGKEYGKTTNIYCTVYIQYRYMKYVSQGQGPASCVESSLGHNFTEISPTSNESTNRRIEWWILMLGYRDFYQWQLGIGYTDFSGFKTRKCPLVAPLLNVFLGKTGGILNTGDTPLSHLDHIWCVLSLVTIHHKPFQVYNGVNISIVHQTKTGWWFILLPFLASHAFSNGAL